MSEKTTKRQVPPQLRGVQVRADSFNETNRTVSVIWTRGTRVLRTRMFDEPFHEELSLDPAHIRLERFRNGGLPFLPDHNRFNIREILGRVRDPQIRHDRAEASIHFSSREDVEPFVQDVRDGVVRDVSVGYRVFKYEEAGLDDSDGFPILRAIDWEPMELSAIAVSAEGNTQIRSNDVGENACEFPISISTRGNGMPEEIETPEGQSGGTENEVSTRAERKRINGIREAGRMAGSDETLVQRMIDEGTPEHQARQAIIEDLGDRQRRTMPQPNHNVLFQHERGIADEIPAMAEALASRHCGIQPGEHARQFTARRIPDLARGILDAHGVYTRMMTDNQVISRAMSVSDFPQLLVETGNRTLRRGYDLATAGVRAVSRQNTAPDFRGINRLQFGEAPELEKVNEHGEFKRGKIDESKEVYKLGTYGRVVSLTRQALVNDDLGAFAETMQRMGQQAAQFEAMHLVTLLDSNPEMYDGNTLFHANHGNLASSGAAMSVTTLSTARKAMRLQKGLDGKTPIDAAPTYLLVPAALETDAEKLLSEIYAAKVTDANPFTRALQVIIEPRLDQFSTSAWYVFSDPDVLPTLEYAYLQDEPGPQLFTREGFDVDGLDIKIRLDFGAGAIDWRGAYKNPGA